MANEDIKAFMNEVLAVAPAEQKAALEAAFGNESVAAKLRDGVLARSDYSRQSDALRTERQRFEQDVQTAKERISGWEDWYARTSSEFAQQEETLKQYQSQFGQIDGTQRPGMSKEDVAKMLQSEIEKQKRDLMDNHLALVDKLTDIKFDHQRQFGESLKTTEFLKYAQDSGLPADIAYREFIRPRIEEQNKKDFAEQLKKAREEGRKEYASEHKLPVTSLAREPHVLDMVSDRPKTVADRINAAVSSFNELASTRN